MTLGDARQSALYAKATAADARRLTGRAAGAGATRLGCRRRYSQPWSNPSPRPVMWTASRLTTFPIMIALKAQPPGGWVNVPAQAEIILNATIKSIAVPERCVRTDPSGRSVRDGALSDGRPPARRLTWAWCRTIASRFAVVSTTDRPWSAGRSSMGVFVTRIGGNSVIARNIISEAATNLRRRRLQATLSSFGIATGIAAVVLLVSIVSGVHHFMQEQFGSIGGNVIQVTTNQQRSTRDPRGFQVTVRPSDMDPVLGSTPHFDIAGAENSGNGIVRTARRSTQRGFIRGVTGSGFDDARAARRARTPFPGRRNTTPARASP